MFAACTGYEVYFFGYTFVYNVYTSYLVVNDSSLMHTMQFNTSGKYYIYLCIFNAIEPRMMAQGQTCPEVFTVSVNVVIS